jgi:heparan-alpha-glucosaminide N-acetyltransferase
MGGYELVRSDDPESGAAKGAASAAPAPAAARQRLVSLYVFRGITVLVRAPANLFYHDSAAVVS